MGREVGEADKDLPLRAGLALALVQTIYMYAIALAINVFAIVCGFEGPIHRSKLLILGLLAMNYVFVEFYFSAKSRRARILKEYKPVEKQRHWVFVVTHFVIAVVIFGAIAYLHAQVRH